MKAKLMTRCLILTIAIIASFAFTTGAHATDFTGNNSNVSNISEGNFYDTSTNLYPNGRVTTGNFYNSSKNYGTVTTGIFNNTSYNLATASFRGTVGTATFNGGASIALSSYNLGDVTNGTFNAYSRNTANGAIRGNVGTGIFNDNSYNAADVTNGTFNEDSRNSGIVTTGTFTGYSYNASSGTVGTATFHDCSANEGTVTGTAKYMYADGGLITIGNGMYWGSGSAGSNVDQDDSAITQWVFTGDDPYAAGYNDGDLEGATFNGYSYHNMGVVTTATFNDDSYNWNEVVNATFNDNSFNAYDEWGIVTNATFNDNSYNAVGGEIENATFTGTNVNDGAITGTTTISAGATLSGTGTLGTLIQGSGTISSMDVVIGDGVMMSPGSSPGILTISDGTLTWEGGGTVVFQIYDTSLEAGTGWDLIRLTNGALLDITATSDDKFNIIFEGLSGLPDTLGQPLNFNPAQNYSWLFVDSSDGLISGFNLNKFNITYRGFTDLAGGGFTLEEGSIRTKFEIGASPVPEPATMVSILSGLAMMGFRRVRRLGKKR
jgi:hypothetical protein